MADLKHWWQLIGIVKSCVASEVDGWKEGLSQRVKGGETKDTKKVECLPEDAKQRRKTDERAFLRKERMRGRKGEL